MLIKRWAKLDDTWYRDIVIKEIVKQEPVALGLWPVLICMAKEASHDTENPSGSIKTTLDELSSIAVVDISTILKALDLFTEGELLNYWLSKKGVVEILHIELLRFQKWQSPRKSARERAEKNRAKKSEVKKPVEKKTLQQSESFAGKNSSSVTVEYDSVLEIEKEREIEKENSIDLLDVNLVELDKANSPMKQLQVDVQTVFDYWVETTGRNPAKCKLTKERRAKIKARFDDKYSVADLKQTIDYYNNDSFHQGANSNGKVYNDLVTYLRNETKVEQALTATDTGGAKSRAVSSTPSVLATAPDADKLRRYDEFG